MSIDIRTLFVVQAVVAFLDAFIITLAWHYAKSMQKTIGYWSLNLILVSIGTLLTAFREIIPNFLSLIIANIFISISYIPMQEGISDYIGKKGYLRIISLVVVFLQSVLYLYFYYIIPSISSRILVFDAGGFIIS